MKATLVFPVRNNFITLAIKKKKIGAGKWNGYGGKPEPEDKTIRDTALRELFDESGKGLTADPEDLIPCALVDFYFFENETDTPNWSVVVYLLQHFSGAASGTDEMGEPRLFPIDAIPYENMMPGDREFLPKILRGETFHGIIRFNEDQTAVKSSKFEPMDPGLLAL